MTSSASTGDGDALLLMEDPVDRLTVLRELLRGIGIVGVNVVHMFAIFWCDAPLRSLQVESQLVGSVEVAHPDSETPPLWRRWMSLGNVSVITHLVRHTVRAVISMGLRRALHGRLVGARPSVLLTVRLGLAVATVPCIRLFVHPLDVISTVMIARRSSFAASSRYLRHAHGGGWGAFFVGFRVTCASECVTAVKLILQSAAGLASPTQSGLRLIDGLVSGVLLTHPLDTIFRIQVASALSGVENRTQNHLLKDMCRRPLRLFRGAEWLTVRAMFRWIAIGAPWSA